MTYHFIDYRESKLSKAWKRVKIFFLFLRIKKSKPAMDIETDEPYSCNGGVHSGEQFEDGTVAK